MRRARSALVTLAILLALSGCSALSGWSRSSYGRDRQLLTASQEVSFRLLIPRAIPGDPPVVSADVFAPPGNVEPPLGNGPASMCVIQFGELSPRGVLLLTESSGYGVSFPTNMTPITIDAARHISGVIGSDQAYRVDGKQYQVEGLTFQDGNVDIALDSATLSATQLVTIAKRLVPMTGRPGQ